MKNIITPELMPFVSNKIQLELLPFVNYNNNIGTVSLNDRKVMVNRIRRFIEYSKIIVNLSCLREGGRMFSYVGYHPDELLIFNLDMNQRNLYMVFIMDEFFIPLDTFDRTYIEMLTADGEQRCDPVEYIKGEFMEFLFDYTNIRDYVDQ